MQIFISYSSADEVKAKELAGKLEKAGYKCWISCDNLNSDHPVAIPQEIAKSDAVVMVISEHSKDAPGQETEMKLAEKKGVRKEIIPFLLEQVEPADTWLAWPLTGRQSIRGYEQEGWDRLIKRLAELKTCSEGDAVNYDIPQLGKTTPVVNLTTLKETSDIMHFNHALQFDRLLRPRRALEELRKISKQDDLIVRYYTLRIRYTLEGGVDEIELEDVLVKACNLGCADAKVNLASKYLDDWDSKGSANASVNQCMEWLKEAIIAGEPDALAELANAYNEGKCVCKDKSIAEKLFRQAIDAGSLGGRIGLGFFYAESYFDNKDDVKSKNKAEDVLRPILLEHLLKNEVDADKVVHWIIAWAYLTGIVVQKDYSRAIDFFKKVLSSRGKIFSQEDYILSVTWFFLGVIYIDSSGGFKNEQEAFKCFTNACKIGTRDGTAENQLGLCYENGIGVDKDERMAMEWYKRAANKGNASALFSLAINNFRNGIVDEGKAQLSRAVEMGDAEAKLQLGIFLCDGKYFSKNVPKGMEYINHSAEKKCPEAMRLMGLICLGGLYNSKIDVTKAEEWLTMAAAAGDASAENWLAICYSQGSFGRVDKQKAVDLWKCAVEHENVDAMVASGKFYRDEGGRWNDMEKSLALFHQAANKEDPDAMMQLGWAYLKGMGVEKDTQEAKTWFVKAAETGDPVSENALATRLFNGDFGEPSYEEAMNWLKKAVSHGSNSCVGAIHNMGILLQQGGHGIEKDPIGAIEYFRRAADQDYAPSMRELGEMYLIGNGVPINKSEAESWFRKAAETGDKDAEADYADRLSRGDFGCPDSDKVIVGAGSAVAATIGSATCAPIAATCAPIAAVYAPCTLLGVIAGFAHGIKKYWDFLRDDVVERATGGVYGSKNTKSCDERPFVIDRQNMTTGKGRKVFSSVFAPAEIVKNSHLLVQVYLHAAEEMEEISSSAKEAQRDASRRGHIPLVCPLQIGDQVDVVLNIYGQKLIDSQKKSIMWQGSFVNCTFQYFITSKTKLKDVCCEVLLFMKNVPIGEMLFTVEIVDAPKSLPAEVTTRRFKKVFISYAHQDESQVRFMARGFKKLGVDYFFDRDYLKAGDVFPVIIQEYINTADLFVLFWSKNAAKSEYVGKELSQALELAFPKIKPPEKATLSICAYSIEPKAELPASMRNDYNFEEI